MPPISYGTRLMRVSSRLVSATSTHLSSRYCSRFHRPAFLFLLLHDTTRLYRVEGHCCIRHSCLIVLTHFNSVHPLIAVTSRAETACHSRFLLLPRTTRWSPSYSIPITPIYISIISHHSPLDLRDNNMSSPAPFQSDMDSNPFVNMEVRPMRGT